MTVREKMEDFLILLAEKIDDNKYLQAIKNTFTIYMPFIIVGSFGTLFSALISNPKTGLAQWIPALGSLSGAFSAMNFATMTFMTIPIVFLIAMHLAKSNKTPEYLTGIVAVVSYVAVIQQVIEYTMDDKLTKIGAIPSTALGPQGLFIGMLIAIIVSEVKVKECRRKAAEKREREEERAIIRKIKAEDKAAEDFKKYNIVIGG